MKTLRKIYLQDLSDRIKNRSAVPALPHAESRRQRKGPAENHSEEKLPLLMAVPTTAGTGSETTLAAVITDGQTRHKYAINDFPLIPRYAVLDPGVTLGLPPFITATTGMDALTHAVEAYIGNSMRLFMQDVHSANPMWVTSTLSPTLWAENTMSPTALPIR